MKTNDSSMRGFIELAQVLEVPIPANPRPLDLSTFGKFSVEKYGFRWLFIWESSGRNYNLFLYGIPTAQEATSLEKLQQQAAEEEPYFQFSRKSRMDQWAEKWRLNQPYRLGVTEFDRQVYVQSAIGPTFCISPLLQAEVRNEILRVGNFSIYEKGLRVPLARPEKLLKDIHKILQSFANILEAFFPWVSTLQVTRTSHFLPHRWKGLYVWLFLFIGMLIRPYVQDKYPDYTNKAMYFSLMGCSILSLLLAVITIRYLPVYVRRFQFSILVFVCCFYPLYQDVYTGLIFVNGVLDRTPAYVYQTSLLAAPKTGGRGRGPYIRFQSFWEENQKETELPFKSTWYHSYSDLRPGATAEVWVRPGALGIPWIEKIMVLSRDEHK